MLYEKFYAGSSIVVRNQSDREAPWESFHATVDRLLAGIEVPGPALVRGTNAPQHPSSCGDGGREREQAAAVGCTAFASGRVAPCVP